MEKLHFLLVLSIFSGTLFVSVFGTLYFIIYKNT